jgi:hypothetical protein
MSMKTIAVHGDTWQTDQADLVRFASENPIPRKGAWVLQLRRDLRSWFMWLIGAMAITSLAVGITTPHILPILHATLILLIVVGMFVSVSRGHATSPLVRAVISDPAHLRRHPLFLGQVAKASVDFLGPDITVKVGLTNSQAVELLRKNGRIEVLIMHDPKVQYSSVIAWRVAA